jgi:four helix bundle protein
VAEREPLIPKHGGYRKLKSFQVAQLVYDVTVRFCDRYIPRRSRTHDQMVQAARSGVQNIAEGSQASGTSKKTELKLTNVARASLEELRLDYEDFLRQHGHPIWPRDVLEDRLRQALVRLNPTLLAYAIEDAFRKLTRPEGPTLEARNRALHRFLVEGVTVESPRPDGSIAGAQAQVVDFDSAENNDWLAVNQFTVSENKHMRRPVPT